MLAISSTTFAQSNKKNEKAEIKAIVTEFMNCLVKKDSVKFYGLFYPGNVAWVGGIKDKTFQDNLKNNAAARDYFIGDYKQFYRFISDSGADQEKFYNINIENDENIAAVIFDYSFWKNKIKQNWGKESWGLVKVDGQWKIASVLFSIEMEKISPEPKMKNKTLKQ